MRFVSHLPALLVGLLLALPAVAQAQGGPVSIQLNKLEPDGDACRAYLLMENGSDSDFESLSLDLVMFDNDGIIARRLAVETAPLPAGKTSVKVFGISDLPCGEIGRVLLNGVLDCVDQTGERGDCLGRIAVDSLAGVPFIE
ncbi:Tat pathway signal sequence domain protein [Sediminicurvatus halobius]|uniref:Tat pathway signal sequence domain protein n=1 Tax=Sediminicurvatus halobius TaxID=2182432 RepID=A0A2U2N3Q5_9GAMM|nr:Tat pathway signal sequence domain protein [Spiribacter halobius]PWG63722.1 Tat pathway signal sequence domain protein [Spiribacter halobius]UEX79859.1 Tat pathway signal sequence domain protein [Spiribacter halobius]